ncbi:hypothetical protein N7495_006973 [Penicillium taxi]|uniref:uncharacterized protein n=1 Tax=Penicillium taxi TaxID=168475 RepID=UPI0025455181|nr:uncharacterized protein N7495_006973 [Penicillium taxi]KAJ5895282.1 hypothetical protein N7495_006973 [Penicillium taxi]
MSLSKERHTVTRDDSADTTQRSEDRQQPLQCQPLPQSELNLVEFDIGMDRAFDTMMIFEGCNSPPGEEDRDLLLDFSESVIESMISDSNSNLSHEAFFCQNLFRDYKPAVDV